MNERNMTLGRDWQPGDILRGWLLSEKLEDVRAFWDGSTAWTRGGNVIELPDFIRDTLPTGRSLDGGIFAGHGQFEVARLAVQFNRWMPACRFVAFDSPDTAGTWQRRMAEAALLYHDVIPFTACKSLRQANRMLVEIKAAGGEGIVARHPGVVGYQRGHTENFLKIKTPVG